MRMIATAGALAAAVLVAACGSKAPAPADNQSAASSTAAADSTMTTTGQSGMNDMQNMPGMTGDPDRDFLRMMSDHHTGLIAMAQPTIQSKENLSVKPDARQLNGKQNAELEKMTAMLRTQYNDDYTPKISPSSQQMVDELKGKSGKEYSRTFLANVIKHHQQAIKMIDDYLPKAKSPAVKSMAEKMKADQTKEITRFQKELAAA